MQKPRRGGEGRPGGRFGHAVDGQRPAHADLLFDNAAGQLADAGELAGAAGEHDAPPGNLVEAGLLEGVTNHLQRLFDARADDSDQHGAGNLTGLGVGILADPRHLDDLPVVRRRRQGAAVQCLHPFGLVQGRRQATGDVIGHVDAANGDDVGVDQFAVEEDGDGRCAAAHIDTGDA